MSQAPSFPEFLDLLDKCLSNYRNLIENVKLNSTDETVHKENERLRENFRLAKLDVIRAYDRAYGIYDSIRSILEQQEQR